MTVFVIGIMIISANIVAFQKKAQGYSETLWTGSCVLLIFLKTQEQKASKQLASSYQAVSKESASF